MTDTRTTKKVQAKHPRSRAANAMAIAANSGFPMPAVEMSPIGRNESSDSDSAYGPVPMPITAARTNPY